MRKKAEPIVFNQSKRRKNFKDKSGKRYNHWVALRFIGVSTDRKYYYEFQCDCGTKKLIREDIVVRGASKSCGCKDSRISHGHCSKKNQCNRTPEYRAWTSMRRRCLQPKAHNYKHYGGRGVSICKRWDEFENFLSDMGFRPHKSLSLHRVENNGNYEPDNCIWGTGEIQATHKRNNLLIEKGGIKKTAYEWSRENQIPVSVIKYRFKNHWPEEMIFSKKSHRGRRGIGATSLKSV